MQKPKLKPSMQKIRSFSKIALCLMLTLGLIGPFFTMPAKAAGLDIYTLNLDADKPYYYVKGDTINITATSNASVSITLSIYWNWKTFSDNLLIYQNSKTANASWLLYTSTIQVGYYRIVANISDQTVTIWRTLITTSNYSPSSLPFSYSWQGVNYTLQGRSLTAQTFNDVLNLTYPKIPFQYSVSFLVNNMTFLIRLSGSGWAVDVAYMALYCGIKWTINGTLSNPVTFDFQCANNPLSQWKKCLNQWKSSGMLTFDWNDLAQVGKAFSWNSSTNILSVTIPASFSIDPVIFSDGFESGTTSAWTSVVGTPTVQSSTVHSGSYAMNCSATGTYVKKNIGAQSVVSYRTYVSFSALPASGKYASFMYLTNVGNSKGNLLQLYVYNNSGTNSIWMRHGYPTTVDAYYTQTLAINTWYEFEVNMTIDTTNGAYGVYFNDASIISQTGLNTSGAISCDYIYFGEGSSTYTVIEYCDDAVVSTNHIGLMDLTAPTYTSISTSTTLAGASCSFNVQWTDETALATTGGYIFGTNNTGSWVNDTWTAFSSNPQWANVTKTLSTTATVVQYEWWANDTSNNWNNTGIQTLTLTYWHLTFYLNQNGGNLLLANQISMTNTTTTAYPNATALTFQALVAANDTYTFSYFMIGASQIIQNNYAYTVTTDITIWAYFESASSIYTSGYNAGWAIGNATGYSSGWTAGNTTGWIQGNTTGYNQGWSDGNGTGYANGWNAGNSSGYSQGWLVGNSTGYAQGYTDGWNVGNATGFTNGYNLGWQDGNSTGYANGYNLGWTTGNATGYVDGWNTGNATGYGQGWTIGNSSGYTSGWIVGNNTGWITGNSTGWTQGNATGYVTGYGVGFIAGSSSGYSTGWTAGNTTGYAHGYAVGYAFGLSSSSSGSVQPSNETLTVTVHDWLNAPIANASVTVINYYTHKTVSTSTTDHNGTSIIIVPCVTLEILVESGIVKLTSFYALQAGNNTQIINVRPSFPQMLYFVFTLPLGPFPVWTWIMIAVAALVFVYWFFIQKPVNKKKLKQIIKETSEDVLHGT